jgi:dGTPase
MIVDIITSSADKNHISMSNDIAAATEALREFMFKRVYIGSRAKADEDKAKYVVTALFKYFRENCNELPIEFKERMIEDGTERVVCDYIAGMTDIYAVNIFSKLFIPSPWR